MFFSAIVGLYKDGNILRRDDANLKRHVATLDTPNDAHHATMMHHARTRQLEGPAMGMSPPPPKACTKIHAGSGNAEGRPRNPTSHKTAWSSCADPGGVTPACAAFWRTSSEAADGAGSKQPASTTRSTSRGGGGVAMHSSEVWRARPHVTEGNGAPVLGDRAARHQPRGRCDAPTRQGAEKLRQHRSNATWRKHYSQHTSIYGLERWPTSTAKSGLTLTPMGKRRKRHKQATRSEAQEIED